MTKNSLRVLTKRSAIPLLCGRCGAKRTRLNSGRSASFFILDLAFLSIKFVTVHLHYYNFAFSFVFFAAKRLGDKAWGF